MASANGVKLKIDKEIHAVIPPLSTEEFEQLVANITKDGCRDPIVLWKGHGIIVDGHNRYEICQTQGIGFRTVERDFKDKDAVILWVIRNQLGRRNLTPMVRAELALRLKPQVAQQAEQRMKSGYPAPILAQGQTRDSIAEIAGVSHGTIAKVEQIHSDAVPAIQDMARTGEVSVNAAAAVSELPARRQERIAERGPEAVKEAAKKNGKPKPSKKRPEPEATEPTDDIGVPLPDDTKLRAAFGEREKFDKALNSLTTIAKTVNELLDGEARHHLDKQTLVRDGRNLRSQIKHARPYAVCPYCQGLGCQKTHGCRGLGWATQNQFESAPSEMRKAMDRKAVKR